MDEKAFEQNLESFPELYLQPYSPELLNDDRLPKRELIASELPVFAYELLGELSVGTKLPQIQPDRSKLPRPPIRPRSPSEEPRRGRPSPAWRKERGKKYL